MSFVNRTRRMSPSLTLEITAKAKRLRKEGKDVISLSVGEPDFPTPDYIKAAGILAINENMTKYTAGIGTPELRQFIADKFAREYQVHYGIHEIAVSSGAKHTISNTIMALCQEGDEVVIPTPCWLSYPDMVYLAEAEPVLVPTTQQNRFKITPAQLESSINQHTRIVLLNSPSNPTGMVYSKDELAELVQVIQRHPRVMLLADEIYEKLVYGDKKYASPIRFQQIREQLLIVNGVSKAYAMTGWRIGYLLAPEAVIQSVSVIQSQMTSSPNSIAQYAAGAAIAQENDDVRAMYRKFEERKVQALEWICELPNVTCEDPDGAFYLFPDFSAWLGKVTPEGKTIADTVDLASWLMDEALVAVVPGKAFFGDGHLRLSFAASLDVIREAISRIDQAIRKLK